MQSQSQTQSQPQERSTDRPDLTRLPEGIREKILRELLQLEGEAMLGTKFVMVEQGMRIGAYNLQLSAPLARPN